MSPARRAFSGVLAPAAGVAALCVVGPTPTLSQEVSRLEVELMRVGSYGWGDLGDATRELSSTERAFEGGVIGAIAGLDVNTAGHVYVLDRGFFKIVEFAPDGALVRVIPGGAGEGPGEFLRPGGVSVSETGIIATNDGELARVTLFSEDGELLDTWRTERPAFSLSVLRDSVYLLEMSHTNRTVGSVYALDGTRIRPLFELPHEEADVGRFAPGVLSRTGTGLVYAGPRIGEWRELARPDAVLGEPVFPDLEGHEVVDGRFVNMEVPAGVEGLGRTPDGYTLVFYRVYDAEMDPDLGLRANGVWVAIFDTAGAYRGRQLLFPAEPFHARMMISPHNGHLYVGVWEPHPHVSEYDVTIRPAR